MMKEISIIKKDEAYTYDELAFIEESLLPLVTDEQKEAMRKRMQLVNETRRSHEAF